MVPDKGAASMEARLTAMRTAYLERLREEVVGLVELADKLATACQHEVGPPCRELLTTLEARLHKLAGSCGTFGFSSIGQAARQLEHEVAKFRALDHIDREDLRTLAATVEALPSELIEENTVAAEGLAPSEQASGSLVWVIDRDPLLASFVARQLTSLGFRVSSAEQLPPTPPPLDDQPDCLLIDHNADRPVTEEHPDGVPWATLLAGYQGVTIFMGAREDFTSRLNAERAGARGYVVKPLDVPRLASRIAHLLKDSTHAAERVLIVGTDTRSTAALQERLTALDIHVHRAVDPSELLHHVARVSPELVLLDIRSGEVRDDELVGVLRQYLRWASMPIVVLVDDNDPDSLPRVLARGADAVFPRSTSVTTLARVLRAKVHRARERDALIARDGLTGLLKQNAIRDALRGAHESAIASRTPLSVVMLDVDHFKRINDTHGHAVGDLVISTIASIMREHFRASDALGRYGGEEFTVVLPKCTEDAAFVLLEGLREAFHKVQFVGRDQQFTVSLSAGIASTESFPKLSPDALLEAADTALYAAKAAGRNRVHIARST